jgi:hypothetical protein
MAKKTWMLLFLFACGIKQPVEPPDTTLTVGYILVNSQPQGARIFLDNINTGLFTPDTLDSVTTGIHKINVFRSGYTNLSGSIQVLVTKDSAARAEFTLQKMQQSIRIPVVTSPDSAEIWINDAFTGQYTPDTLLVEAGVYPISAKKNGFQDYVWEAITVSDTIVSDTLPALQSALEIRQTVMMESFGNVSCQPCTTAAQNLEQFISEHAGDAYALMEYYAYWPKADDPLYKESPNDVKERLNYYSVFTLPTLKLNGSKTSDASQYNSIESDYREQAGAQNTPLAISLTRSLDGGVLKVAASVYDYNNLLVNQQLRLFVAVAEDSIHYASPPGDNGLKDFNFVFRNFLSSRKGDVLNATDAPVKMRYQFAWPGNLDYSNSKIIAFIQDITTKQIIQTTVI